MLIYKLDFVYQTHYVLMPRMYDRMGHIVFRFVSSFVRPSFVRPASLFECNFFEVVGPITFIFGQDN